MRAGWEYKTLDQISTNLDSERIPITRSARSRGEYPYYGASGVVDYVADYIFEGDALLVSEDGANLLARSSPIAFSVAGKYWVNNHAHILKFDDAHTRRFVELYLESIPIDDYVTGAAQPKLNQRALNSIPIPMPPLPERRRIVSLLEEACDGIAAAKANADKNLHSARALFESEVQSAFTQRSGGWLERKFEELIESSLVGLTRSAREQGNDRAWPYVKMNNITPDNRFDFSNAVTVDATEQEVQKFRLRNGDFLFNTRNSVELVGKACLYHAKSEEVVLYNNNIMRVRFVSGVDARLVLFALSFKPVADELNSLKSGATNVSAIYFKDLRSLAIPLPPADDQSGIATRLEMLQVETQRLESIYRQKAAALDALRGSLLHQAFAGHLP